MFFKLWAHLLIPVLSLICNLSVLKSTDWTELISAILMEGINNNTASPGRKRIF